MPRVGHVRSRPLRRPLVGHSARRIPPMMSDPPVRVHRLARRLWRSAVAMLALIGFAFVVVAETPLPNLLVAPLLRIRSSPVKADIAVVLAGGRFTDGSLNQAALERTVAAVRLYHQGVVPLLMFTGGPCCGQSASALMADLAADLGVPRAAILVEEQSLRTRDSAVNVEALLVASLAVTTFERTFSGRRRSRLGDSGVVPGRLL